MKRFPLFLIFLIIYSALHETVYAGGFVGNTLVHTRDSLIPIQDLIINDQVVGYFEKTQSLESIAKKHSFKAYSYLKITIENTQICASHDQQFYSTTHNDWIAAHKLQENDTLLCHNEHTVCVQAIDQINQETTIHTLSVDKCHTFCISEYGIIAHNFEPISIVGAPIVCFLAPTIAPVAVIASIPTLIGAAASGIIFYFVQKHNKKKSQEKKQTFAEIVEEEKRKSGNNGGPKKPKDDPIKYPHGIYKGASYHHKNSKHQKSPGPIDGQKCLNHSIPHTDKTGTIMGDRRYSIEGDNFIELKYTSYREYHGHLIKWNKVPMGTRDIFKNLGSVRLEGKIIKQLTEISPI